jgi:hypothetical protein
MTYSSAYALGERVARDGAFISRRGSGEGLLQRLSKRNVETGKPKAGVADNLSFSRPHLATRMSWLRFPKLRRFCSLSGSIGANSRLKCA